MPNRAIEFHDSTLGSIVFERDDAVLYFSMAYIHETVPGTRGGSGWIQQTRLHIAGASVTGDCSELPSDLWGGELRLDEQRFGLLPVPFDRQGRVQLNLELMPTGKRIQVTGTGLRVEMVGAAIYVEQLPE
jgi:hypothetical protein